jgi:hypothetical protein
MSQNTTENLAQKELLTIKIELTVNELNTVMAALQELPHKIVDNTLRKIFAQAQAQTQNPQE